jgi:hypothetical protein
MYNGWLKAMETKGAINLIPDAAGVVPLGSHAFVDAFALAYHRAVAERLRRDPESVVGHARQNLRRWMEGGGFGDEEGQALEEWRGIIDSSDVERLVEIITDPSDEGQRLRSSSPFVGVLTPAERLEILAACEQRASA